MPQLSLHSPVGDLAISEEDGAIVALDWGWGSGQARTPLLISVKERLEAYFDGKPENFDLPLAPQGTDFQKKIWAAISKIPYGKTAAYKDIAAMAGTPARATGLACGANPIPILIPCHRVLSASGKLGGYSGEGGVETKAALLRLEGSLFL